MIIWTKTPEKDFRLIISVIITGIRIAGKAALKNREKYYAVDTMFLPEKPSRERKNKTSVDNYTIHVYTNHI